MYGVFVYWQDSPNRAERLSNGCTTTRVLHAAMFKSREDAHRAGEQACTGVPGIASWEVRPFSRGSAAQR